MAKTKNNSQQNLIIQIAVVLVLAVVAIAGINALNSPRASTPAKDQAMSGKSEFVSEVVKTDEEWKKLLTPQQYYVLREKGTDLPYSEKLLLNEHRKGTFVTADCGEPVFRSENKFDSGTGWPSFWKPIDGAVVEAVDNSAGISRTEIVGKKCGGHLGHVFNDGPEPTGLRYCINPSALKFIPDPA